METRDDNQLDFPRDFRHTEIVRISLTKSRKSLPLNLPTDQVSPRRKSSRLLSISPGNFPRRSTLECEVLPDLWHTSASCTARCSLDRQTQHDPLSGRKFPARPP
ncbi:uncharacterized protein LOC112345452 [Selaginella moellendorffii]|uniref:uncharacterized protein LOC112345452 n=1 Tax=Selaginella moellendorffii TaxID=88036 RepID=UPI000D1C3057|nr:uncharacterized protein LOC112345452 [Selaginella moellendorffii]|eukprot:XP_024527992.1 uncharacterized protein LOC112345452 [Selaginella moellendorffii]